MFSIKGRRCFLRLGSSSRIHPNKSLNKMTNSLWPSGNPMWLHPLICGLRFCNRVAILFCFFGPKSDHIWIGGQNGEGYPDWMWHSSNFLITSWLCHKASCFITCFTLNWTIIYRMNVMLCWRRSVTSNWDHKFIRKLFTEVINQVGLSHLFVD